MKLTEGVKCKTCRDGKLYKSEVTHRCEREGLEVEIKGIPAFICEKCEQVYFAPGVGDRISAAANELFMLSEIKHVGKFKAAV